MRMRCGHAARYACLPAASLRDVWPPTGADERGTRASRESLRQIVFAGMPSLALGFRLKQGRRDQKNGDLADLLERSQHVSGPPAKLPDGEPRKQEDSQQESELPSLL